MPTSTGFLLPEILTLQPAIPNSVSASPQLEGEENKETTQSKILLRRGEGRH